MDEIQKLFDTLAVFAGKNDEASEKAALATVIALAAIVIKDIRRTADTAERTARATEELAGCVYSSSMDRPYINTR